MTNPNNGVETSASRLLAVLREAKTLGQSIPAIQGWCEMFGVMGAVGMVASLAQTGYDAIEGRGPGLVWNDLPSRRLQEVAEHGINFGTLDWRDATGPATAADDRLLFG